MSRILIFTLALLLCFGGCEAEPNITERSSEMTESEEASEASEISVIQEISVSEPSEVEEVTSEPEVSMPEDKKEELLNIIGSHGKDIKAYGELESAEYENAVAELEAVLDGYDKNISIVAYSLDNGRAISYNTEEKIFPASMIKAAYALYCCKEMENGKASLDTEMVYEEKHYETGTGTLQNEEFGSVFDMRTIIGKTMSISDNVGYLMMVDYFGREGYNQWIADLGAPSLQIKPTVWSLEASAKEFAVVWREICNYFATGSEYADFLYSVCTNTAGNFAAASLDGIDYSHKQGHQRSGDWHSYSDAGIIWDGNDSYIFVIMTDAPGPSDHEEEAFAEIMKIINGKLF